MLYIKGTRVLIWYKVVRKNAIGVRLKKLCSKILRNEGSKIKEERWAEQM
jgi:hypothetical protein